MGDKGRQDPRREAGQGETKPWEGERTIQQGGTMTETSWETSSEGGKTIESNKKKQAGRPWKTRGQDLGKADAPSNKGRRGETRPLERRTHHPRETRRDTMGDKGRQDSRESGQRETKRETMGDKGGHDPREGGHTIQHNDTRRGRMGDKGSQDPPKAGHTIQQMETRRETS